MTASPSAQKHEDLARFSDEIARIAHPSRIVLIVCGQDPRALATVLAEAGEQLGCEVNVTAYSTDELRARVVAGQPFLTGVLDGAKIWLLGDDAELRALLDEVEPASA